MTGYDGTTTRASGGAGMTFAGGAGCVWTAANVMPAQMPTSAPLIEGRSLRIGINLSVSVARSAVRVIAPVNGPDSRAEGFRLADDGFGVAVNNLIHADALPC